MTPMLGTRRALTGQVPPVTAGPVRGRASAAGTPDHLGITGLGRVLGWAPAPGRTVRT